MRRTPRLAALAVLALGCTQKPAPPPPAPPPVQHKPFGVLPRAGEQSLLEAWKTFCDAQQVLTDLKQLPPKQQPQRLALFVHDHVRNQDFVFFIAEMQGLPPAERRARYLQQLKELGISQCEMGEWFFPPPLDGG